MAKLYPNSPHNLNGGARRKRVAAPAASRAKQEDKCACAFAHGTQIRYCANHKMNDAAGRCHLWSMRGNVRQDLNK
jgi:hypothetical protein